MTTQTVVTDIEWTLRIIKDVIGIRVNCIRPPYGDIDDRVRAIIKAMGLTTYLWNYDSKDWKLNIDPNSVDVGNDARIRASTWRSASIGVISLEHDYTDATASKGKIVIEQVRAQGMIPLSVGQCLGSGGGIVTISTNGKCGLIENTKCPNNQCCSKYGYCGINSANCDAGCQVSYGRCGSVTVIPISTNNMCGPQQNTKCPAPYCCSVYNYCGDTDAHCKLGCQPLYGTCI